MILLIAITLGRGTSVGANKAIVIDSTGKVGINVTPTSALDLEIETDKSSRLLVKLEMLQVFNLSIVLEVH